MNIHWFIHQCFYSTCPIIQSSHSFLWHSVYGKLFTIFLLYQPLSLISCTVSPECLSCVLWYQEELCICGGCCRCIGSVWSTRWWSAVLHGRGKLRVSESVTESGDWLPSRWCRRNRCDTILMLQLMIVVTEPEIIQFKWFPLLPFARVEQVSFSICQYCM